MSSGLTFRQFVAPLVWLDRRPLCSVIEPYRWTIFDRAFARDSERPQRFAYDLVLTGRAKKNWKSADLVLACLYALMADSPGGNQCYLLANDADQAADDLTLAKKLIRANPILDGWVTLRKDVIERRDGAGFVEILPAQDVAGSHGKTYRFRGHDEIHALRDWDLLEALAPDPTRLDCQTWITSYASLVHRPGAPLFDLVRQAKAGTDPRLLFSWYAGDFTTDPDFEHASPERRANPSMAGWDNPEYLDQERQRLPAHKFRRLHLNLPGTPEGSAFAAEAVMDAVERGVKVRRPEPGVTYLAFVDMSGGSLDDAVLGVGHVDAQGRAVLDCVIDQGPRPPFDPNAAVQHFARTLKTYRVQRVTGDRYAGLTFRHQFEAEGVHYDVADRTKSELYEAFEPLLNAHDVVLLDVPMLEQQLLGLIWKGGRINHPAGEHDDYANAACGVVTMLLAIGRVCRYCDDQDCDGQAPPMGLLDSPEARAWFAAHPDPDAEPVTTAAGDESDAIDAEAGLWSRLGAWATLAEVDDPEAGLVEQQIRQYVTEVEAGDPVIGARLRTILDSVEEPEVADAV